MWLPRLVYIIPILAISNTVFLMFMHSSYLGALESINAQRLALEDTRYHLENNPNIELKKAVIERQEQLSRWWHAEKQTPDGESTALIVGIPAVPRPQRYLTTTLESIVEQLPSTTNGADTPWRNNIQFYIVNNRPGEFPEFDELHEKYSHVPELVFIENNEKLVDRYADMPDPDDKDNPLDIPGKKVRRQTYDLIALMKLASKKSKYFMFMEDDFPICPQVLDIFYYILRKASFYQPSWKAIRSSYGMNGIFISGKELESLAVFFNENVSHRPPDGLVVEWMCGRLSPTVDNCEKPQRHLTFRWNLFKHIGSVSSLRETGLKEFPGCWHYYSHLLWDIDGYSIGECDDDDFTPCNRPYADTIHRTLDVEGWPYINGFISVEVTEEGEFDVALRQRPLKLIYSGFTSPAYRTTPALLTLFMFVSFCMVVWKILLQ